MVDASPCCETAAVPESQPTSGRKATVVVVVLGCFVAQSFARFTFGLVLPAMKADLRISYGLAGWLGTINLAAYLVSSAERTSIVISRS